MLRFLAICLVNCFLALGCGQVDSSTTTLKKLPVKKSHGGISSGGSGILIASCNTKDNLTTLLLMTQVGVSSDESGLSVQTVARLSQSEDDLSSRSFVTRSTDGSLIKFSNDQLDIVIENKSETEAIGSVTYRDEAGSPAKIFAVSCSPID
jgi:hypothetical protein